MATSNLSKVSLDDSKSSCDGGGGVYVEGGAGGGARRLAGFARMIVSCNHKRSVRDIPGNRVVAGVLVQ